MIRELDDIFVMQGFDTILKHEQGVTEDDAQLVFDFMDLDNIDLPLFGATLVNDILLRLPIDSIVFLDVSMRGFYLSMSCWLSVFGTIPTLEAIRLSTFFHALHPDSGHGRFTPFLALKSISLPSRLITTDFPIVTKILHDRAKVGTRLLECLCWSFHTTLLSITVNGDNPKSRVYH